MSTSTLIIRYASFAIIATVVNLAVQRLVFQNDDTAQTLAMALVAGTLAGLIVKYILDKRWIFFNFESGVRSHSKKFILYTATGFFTTFIFWGMETTTWYLWRTDYAREMGALVGLTIGYIIKYQLDSRYVFSKKHLDTQSQ